MANSSFPGPKFYPLQISAILNKNKNFHTPDFSWSLVWKITAATPLEDQFTWNFAAMCPKSKKEKSESLGSLDGRVLELGADSLMARAKKPPPPPP